MPAFEALARYQPALVLLLGLATFAGALGVGLGGLRALRLRLPAPWREVAAALLGTGLLSLCVQIAAMLGLATRAGLSAVWGAFVLLGSLELGLVAWRATWPRLALEGRGVALALGVLVVAAATNLLLAMAPLTKIDEIFYQVLPPARIALDGELVFYLRPWEAAVVPQMGYPIAGAPLHALGHVDAASVWSWCLGALLAWFVGRLVHEQTRSAFLALFAAASVAVGLYPSVYHTTGGPHALGDLAMAAAALALAFHRTLLRAASPTAYVALLSLASTLAAFTKISLLPIAGLTLGLGLAFAWRARRACWLGLAASAALPWLAFYAPLCVWTWVHSGSPFGPMLADVVGRSTFDPAVHEEIAAARVAGQAGLFSALFGYLVNYPAIYPLSLLALVALPSSVPARKYTVAALFLAQIVIVAILMPHQARFLSGLHHAALVVGMLQLHPHAARWLTRRFVPLASALVLLLPWLGAQAYRAQYLAPIALGIGELDAYYRSYIALYDDFRRLDRILPEDAVLLARNRLPSIYFPRPVYWHHRDLPDDRPAFAVLGTSDRPLADYDCAYLRMPSDCRLGEPVYANPDARYVVLRAPGDPPKRGYVEVRPIQRALRHAGQSDAERVEDH